MSAAASVIPRAPNGRATHRKSRPEIIQKLGVEYWVNLPLEIVEQRISGREAKWRVYYALIRCSYSLPASSPFAVRPRLRNEGFKGWVDRLQKRVGEHRAIRSGELQEETVDTDESGEFIPLTQADLCQITRMSRSHVSEAVGELRAEGLLGPGEVFYPLAVPAPPNPSTEYPDDVPCTGNILARKLSNALGINVTCSGNTPEAVQALEEAYTALNEGRKALRAGIINMLKTASAGNSILIEKERRYKRKTHTQDPPSSPPSSASVPAEEGVCLTAPNKSSENRDPGRPATSRNAGWTKFLTTAQKVTMRYSAGQVDVLQTVFKQLAIDEQLAAIDGIEKRIENGEYANPRYVPNMRRYLDERLWTADLRPIDARPTRGANTVDWDAFLREEEDPDAR